MKIWKNWLRRSSSDSSNTSAVYWASIYETPLHNWIKCTDGDLRFIRKSVDLETEITDQDLEQWNKIYDQYIEKYGLSELYKKLLETMREKALAELEFVTTGDNFKKTEIAILEEKLKTMVNNNGKGMTIDESLVHLSKWLGYRVDVFKTTVTEYFTLLNEYGKAN